MARCIVALAAWVLCLVPSLAHAWGAAGHQAVGALADQLLKGSVAEQNVQRLLDGQDLRTVAVWADCAKGVGSADDQDFGYRNDDARFPECAVFSGGAGPGEFIEFVRNNWKQCGTAHDKEYCHNQYHYADIATAHRAYDGNFVGANTHDVVHAIDAAMARLRGQPVPAPFWFKDDRQALMLLAHYVGDIHQPLHVAAIYLDQHGNAVDPDDKGLDAATGTAGGNLLVESGGTLLHADWDAIPDGYKAGGKDFGALLATAQSVAQTDGDAAAWPQAWATDTIVSGRSAFGGLRFTAQASSHRWSVGGMTQAYAEHEDEIKFQQLAKAGARLAQILKAVWPDRVQPLASVCDSAERGKGYLTADAMPDITAWLPPAPARGSAAEKADIEAFQATRPLLVDGTPRGQQAAEDDVYEPPEVLARFQPAFGRTLSAKGMEQLVTLLCRVEQDAGGIVAPLKLPTRLGGRVRPFVAFPGQKSCITPVDMAQHRDSDLHYVLPDTGSYPSGHALLGMMMGFVLGQLAPEHADALMARGIDFGDSRLVCGFHYPSDLAGGRLTAAVLFSRLEQNPDFVQDLRKIKDELQPARVP
ncbi:MAG: S1/P1 nuclease [Nevskia sp.]|nr:S1/P1 nuclease [Nevskia sp.]